MAIASEILESFVAEAAEARVVEVTADSTVMYDDHLLQGLKQFMVEELYEKLDQEITEKLKIRNPTLEDYVPILVYLSECYRRGIHFQSMNPNLMPRNSYMPFERPRVAIEWWDYDVIKCMLCERVMESDEICAKSDGHHMYCTNCYPTQKVSPSGFTMVLQTKEQSIEYHNQTIVNRLRNSLLHSIKTSLDKSRSTLKKIKALQLASIKKPRVYDEINELMDAILDANGNKISEFKDYLSPEHYRIIRAGCDVSEIKEQDELLRCLKHMKSQIKK